MPSDQSTWLISAPQDSEAEGLLHELESTLRNEIRSFDRNSLTQVTIPSFKVCATLVLHSNLLVDQVQFAPFIVL